MATYEDKYMLISNSYAGRSSFHDTLEAAKAHYDVLMADEVYMSFDGGGDIYYRIEQVTIINP